MLLLPASLSAAALSVLLAVTCEAAGCLTTVTKNGVQTVIDLCGPVPPPDDPAVTAAPQQPLISHPDSQAGCLETLTRPDGTVVTINICSDITATDESPTTVAPHHTSISHPPLQDGCLFTSGSKTINLCTDRLTAAPGHISIGHHTVEAGCVFTSGTKKVNICQHPDVSTGAPVASQVRDEL